ncbi:1-deoxy-D-xylulose-5-phosphate synthase [bacterium]|nr:MAG: 1-deoxy-D-xylulose-5-phosphate synthase [bacterium]
MVELTVALHHVFHSPRDRIIWDVGHQAYGHKVLTGRRDRFDTIRQADGLSGFPKRGESPHDSFGVGHSSTSISAALGYAKARDLRKEKHSVVAVIGDGAITGGMAFEGLNNVGDTGTDMIVILNDNEMSISPNVGAINRYLTEITSGRAYNKFEQQVWDLLGKLPKGNTAQKIAQRAKESLKTFMTPGHLFEALGFRYFGPIDGHDLDLVIETLRDVRHLSGPTLLHVVTEKGKGYSFAEADKLRYHGVSRFDRHKGIEPAVAPATPAPPSYTKVFGDFVLDAALKDRRIVAITAAMPDGTGLVPFREQLGERFFDVGIAEQHAVTFAAGLACRGMKPVVAIYSTFLQRAYDQLIHDVALQKLNVVFALDRGGVVGADGPTHHGVFDLAYLRCVPDLVTMAPSNELELQRMLATSLEYEEGPIALRYPRGNGLGVELPEQIEPLPIGRGAILEEGSDVLFLGLGTGTNVATEVAAGLRESGGPVPTVVDARFLKPLDEELILQLAARHELVCTFEEGTVAGGFGSAVLELLHERMAQVPMTRIFGLPDRFLIHGTPDEVLAEAGFDVGQILPEVTDAWAHRDRKVDFPGHSRDASGGSA